MLANYLHSLSRLVIIINPLTMFALFCSYTSGMPVKEVKTIGSKTTIAVAITLILCVLGGTHIFQLFGINIAALQFAGGLSLLMSSLKGLGEQADNPLPVSGNIAIVPLCIPVIAGPAAMSIAISLTQQTHNPLAVSLAIVTVALILGVLFYFSQPVCRWLGETVMNIIKRISWLALACIGTQLLMAGFTFYIKV
ncbi:MarC family protein [Lelliottia sp. V106_10]|uniref:UPF0056 membrane protein n=1 Tax=Lelliottia wanjuensis TaxID=3050585 RepID=A0AAP4FZ14_9ENTR|nr:MULTISPECIES: MarC family protein [unclassified Lelliottia]MDK9357720.1 MarC family protein [Lelliottia sp. V106_16]MDK9366371.1 MarC family protein [Lelliottia sp. V106_12]MDK9372788.1 MarC family protein [Lelliottia sp. V106_10]MDK9599592.1 MarC family protein [Lelliottia sp. V106_5]MDK9615930.1 MarC family protein [Lelliottia sp. V106_9]